MHSARSILCEAKNPRWTLLCKRLLWSPRSFTSLRNSIWGAVCLPLFPSSRQLLLVKEDESRQHGSLHGLMCSSASREARVLQGKAHSPLCILSFMVLSDAKTPSRMYVKIMCCPYDAWPSNRLISPLFLLVMPGFQTALFFLCFYVSSAWPWTLIAMTIRTTEWQHNNNNNYSW